MARSSASSTTPASSSATRCARSRRPGPSTSGRPGPSGSSSGTAALELALRALDIGPGDEVITTAHTFIATAEAITNVGARPVFADIDPVTYNLDPSHVEDLITARTRAIMPVHLYGQPADLDALMEIAERHGLWVIEDAAQAHGAEFGGRRCGSIGHLACFSFYPGKNLGAYGDAGAVTGNDPAVLDRIRRMRDHGRTTKYEHDRGRVRRAHRCAAGRHPRREAAPPRGVDRGPPPSRRPLRRAPVGRGRRRSRRCATASGTSTTSTSSAPNVGTRSWST